MSTDKYHEFYQLLGALREDTITPEQAEQLKSWLTQDLLALQYYIEYMTCCSDLRDIASSCPQDFQDSPGASCCEIQELSNKTPKQETNTTAIREYAQQAYEQFKQQEKQREEELARRAYVAARRRLIVGLSSLAALIAMALFAWLAPEHRSDTITPVTQTAPPPPPMVASVTETWEASWNLSHTPLAPDSRLRASTPIQLHQGVIRLTLDQGTEVLIQAPCSLTLQNANRLLVSSGIVSASVPPQAKGFVIETPNGQITDYGTEFGIIVRQTGETETQVYKGEVHLTNHTNKIPLKLFQGQIAAFNTSGNMSVKTSSSVHILREMPINTGLGIPGKQLNVADFIGNGNGLGSGETNCAIDETTGQLLTQINPNGADWKWMDGNLNDFTYQPVPNNPYIDGVFVPITSSGALQVSSEAHAFTMPTQAIKQRFVRGIINWSSSENATLEQNTKLTLNGIVFESLKFPAILMRRNKGITFDLNAIRQNNPGAKIERFTALCGISESDNLIAGNKSRADFYVLVDGQERYSRKEVSASSGGAPLSVRIYPEDQYLTLIVAFSKITDNGVNRALFGIPALEFEAK